MSNSERHDDDLAVFKRKMALFKQYTLPMLKLLDEQGSLKVVEGDSDLDTVFKDASYVVSQILFQENGGVNSLEDD
nr:Adenylate kinase family protein [Haemonchus contortus]